MYISLCVHSTQYQCITMLHNTQPKKQGYKACSENKRAHKAFQQNCCNIISSTLQARRALCKGGEKNFTTVYTQPDEKKKYNAW